MNICTKRAIGLAVCASALFFQAAVRADDPKPATLAKTVKVGDAVKYKGTIKIDLGGMAITVVQNRKHVVKEIKANGDVVSDIVDEGGKVDLGSGEMDVPAKPPETITSDKLGKITAYKPSTEPNMYLSDACLHLLSIVDRIVFSDKPVKPGDSWTSEVENPVAKGKKVAVKTTYVGTEKADGADAWKVKQTLDADTEGGKMTADVTALLDAATGQLISADQAVKGVPANNGPIDWTHKLVRVKADAAKAEK
jgi:hypothetical protein